MDIEQLPLFASTMRDIRFPTTRYQGSKRRLLDWIENNVQPLRFETVLDVFGGTGAVSHLFKRMGKQVTYNDLLGFNCTIAHALIENNSVTLSSEDVDDLVHQHGHVTIDDFIARTFHNIYFTFEENCWLDTVVQNIAQRLENPFKQAIARFALYQACMAKRPYNLFHRANLYMRTADVPRTFGNKVTWDTPFETHFRAFAQEANRAVFDNGREHTVLHADALSTPEGANLVYIDPPYINQTGVGVDYLAFYHFLEGINDYSRWAERIDYATKHRRLRAELSEWSSVNRIYTLFEQLLALHRNSIIVISYRADGIPSAEQLITLLSEVKTQVQVVQHRAQYALAHRPSRELLLIGT